MPVLTSELHERAQEIVARYPAGRERSAIMPLLYLVQSVEGWVTREGLREVADLLGIRTAEVEAVASFYTMLRLGPTGEHLVAICTNLSCALLGAKDVMESCRRAAGLGFGEETTDDGLITVHEEECLGVCEFAPAVQINAVNHDRVSPEAAAALVEALRRGEMPEPARGEAIASFKRASRVLAGLEPREPMEPMEAGG